jgi:polyketide biosynthesis enoyl-CoA hydratase PksH
MSYDTIDVTFEDAICRVRINRPDAGNTINARLVEELHAVVSICEQADVARPVTIFILEGLPEVFCAGGDFAATNAGSGAADPEPLYDLWVRLSRGPFVAISVVRGRANAGGVGMASACDIVLADRTASFGLSELLFGLYPACVLPFLVRRIGLQKAHYLALMTRPIGAEDALRWGLVDAVDDDADKLLRQHVARLQRLSRPAIGRYKRYIGAFADHVESCKPLALEANREMFADPEIRRNILRYMTELKFPWDT